jgi:predicted nucleotidyltransferase
MLDKSDTWKTLELFFKKPLYPFHLREICRILKWSPTKVRMLLDQLKKSDLVKEVKEKNLSIFRPNPESEDYKRYKLTYNLMQAIEITNYLEDKLEFFDAIIFFGSASRGEDIENSDFDICVVGRKEAEIDLKDFEKKISRKISLLFIESFKELKEKNPELSNNLINGMILKGYLKVFK